MHWVSTITNFLIFNTFDRAVKLTLNPHSLFHSDRGYQYTSRASTTSSYRHGAEHVTRGTLYWQGRLLGHPETGTLWWKTFYQQAETCADDCGLHPLLYHQESSAQPGRADSDGEALVVPRCIKSGQNISCWPRILNIFLLFSWWVAIHFSYIRGSFVYCPFLLGLFILQQPHFL